ncbi:Protein WAVE-DAMPENED 2 [Morella rubra]|uniref:Protein WAVE-DAMPENED 2 n=1 Tax=Morella rubra TaxID=262757 RepID=A0A6A1UFV4_9ROSI|nr:Protein WAVE-DAMPENED 2 [Morella rubra]KAB1199411.1 Protein WAVE-DAMPENED 2 [Morella rubra]
MDTADIVVGIEERHQNEGQNSGTDGIMEKESGALPSTVEYLRLDESALPVNLLQKSGNLESSSEKEVERPTFLDEFTGLTIAKESGEGGDTKSMDNSQKTQGMGKATKQKNLKIAVTSVKKNKDEKLGSAALKKPSAVTTNMTASIMSIHSSGAKKVASAASPACHSLQSAESCTTVPPLSTTVLESLRSPPVESAKPRRVGHLPSYGFSLKCDERAQKRKEFLFKLEEKVHAKEVEKTTFESKSKESQEAEIKMLRRSLKFKATPMPSFYHEPVPPKVEFKKIAPTRARSPKLGRHKRSMETDSKGSSSRSRSSRSGHVSLDEKVTRNGATKESSTALFRKPVQKSLPRLPSEKTILANSTEDATFLTPHLEQHEIEQGGGKISEPSQIETGTDANLQPENKI